MKRQRGRGRKPPGHQPNRNFESTGPDVKIRGSASHVYERYMQLARDAYSAGDRVMAENYMQHAEHYFRILKAMQPQHVQPQFEQRFDQAYDVESDDGEGGETDADGDDEGEAPEAQHAAPQEQGGDPQDQRDPDMQRQRRRRRSRFRGPGEGGGGPRQPRGEGEQPHAVEGFGQSTPAFLSND